MKLSKLLEKLDYELLQGSLDTEVSDLAYDSRKIKPGMLFVAIAGTVVDGHKFIPDVVERGASVLVVERDVEAVNPAVTVVKVKNGRAALSLLSQAYFDYPASRMISIGITGTKGKSTTTYMIRDIIEKSGKTCGIVGTIGVAIKGEITPTEHTTPESYDLQKYFHDMVEAGCDYMVMEVRASRWIVSTG
jgi:UDP-N-acetylmuramoyl-L-alanyl-D-glutamate--2,6-diaminopimelate ligase